MQFKLRSAMNYRGNINSHKLYVIYTLLPYVIANYTAAKFSRIFLEIPGINYRYVHTSRNEYIENAFKFQLDIFHP